MGINSDFSCSLGGDLDIGLEISTSKSNILPLLILTILVFNFSSLFLLIEGI